MNEQDFYREWRTATENLSPFEMACRGGELAVSPGLIFLAGYQAAIRATFPTLEASGWYSFAVTEDRSPETARPAVTRDGDTVTGHKTWIAGVNCIDDIVLKVGNGEDAVYGTVRASDPGVTLSSREANFLADMSQGSAELNLAKFSPLQDAAGVRAFRRHEPYYIYIAFLARLAKAGPFAELAQVQLEVQRQAPDIVVLDREVTAWVEKMNSEGSGLGNNWAVDQRLFTMYSKGIQSSQEASML